MTAATQGNSAGAPNPGDRGIPSLNAARTTPSGFRRAVIAVTLVGALAGVSGAAYATYSRRERQDGAPRDIEIKPAATRKFDTRLPPAAPVSSRRAEGGAEDAPPPLLVPSPAAAGRVEGVKEPMAERRRPSVVDKDAAPMMVVVEGGGDRAPPAAAPKGPTGAASGSTPTAGAREGGLGPLLASTATPARSASLLRGRDYLLVKGTMIDCALRTRIDTTVPGMTSCTVTRDVYGDTGRVVLIERGSVVTGEYQQHMQQGMTRVFVAWNRLKTPAGVVAELDSPGTDALGAGGIPGDVNTHFLQRFGSAILLSLVQDVGAAAVNAVSKNDGVTLTTTGGAAQNMATEALRNSINIPPTLSANEGSRIGIFVARDVNFGSVYDLSP